MSELITTKQLGEKLNLTEQTVRRLKEKGMPFKKVGASFRYDYQEVVNWIDKQSVKS